MLMPEWYRGQLDQAIQRPVHRLVGRRSGTVRAHRLQKSGNIVYTRGMPWMETESDGRQRDGASYLDYESGQWSMTRALPALSELSRPTGYKWVQPGPRERA